MQSITNMGTNVPRIVREIKEHDILKRVFLEAITNSIHAKATKIDCFVEVENTLFDDDEKLENKITGNVQKITIKDNGVGFDKDNLKSFKEHQTDYKEKQWGAKGTGRFCFLKLSDTVNYKSLNKEIILNINGEITEIDKDNSINETILELLNIKLKNKLSLDDFNEDISIIYNKILPTLILVKEKNYVSNLDIRFFYNGKNIKSFSLNNIPKIEKDTFTVKTDKDDNILFDLLYYIGDEINIKESGYCADFIKVRNIGFKINIPSSYIIFVQSEYLNDRIDDSRTNFTIDNNNTDLLNPISFNKINEMLKVSIQRILNKKFPDMDKKNKENFKRIVDKFPFFEKDFNNIKTNNIGYLEAKDYVKSSHKILDDVINNLRTLQIKSLDETLTSNELQTIINNSSVELADYVVNRQIIIDQMQKLIDENTNIEDEIHNLILQKGTSFSESPENYLDNLKNCNLWLFDDKFMNFSKVLSDKQLNNLKDEITNYEQVKKNKELTLRPDISLYFNSADKDKMVIIEFKPFYVHGISDSRKINAIPQMYRYARAIKKHFNAKETWYYLVTTIDDYFKDDLDSQDYKKVVSFGEMYFLYNSNIDTSFYVLDMQTLLNDANARNKVFMDILTQHFNQ